MTKPQLDKVTTYTIIQRVLDDTAYQPIWSALPAFEDGVTAFYGSINVLAALAQTQGVGITGLAADKERLAKSVISRTLIVAGITAAYASAKEDRTLFGKADIKKGKFQKLRDAALDDAAQSQHDLAADLLAKEPAEAARAGLTAAKLTDLQTAIVAYTALIGTPAAARAKRKSATDSIPDEIRRADRILDEQLDRLILQFEADHAAFFAAYQTARNIVQTGNTPEKPTTPSKP